MGCLIVVGTSVGCVSPLPFGERRRPGHPLMTPITSPCTLYNPFTRATPDALHAPQHPYRMRAGDFHKTHAPLQIPPPGPAAALAETGEED